MSVLKIALATCSQLPELYEDDQSTLPVFKKVGVFATPKIWDQRTDWSEFDAVIIRSTWDYWQDKYTHYLKWIDQLKMLGVAVFNSPEVIKNNTIKTYLKQLAAQNIPIIPTLWIMQERPEELAPVLARSTWNEFILKPTLSAGANRTYRFKRSEIIEYENQLTEILSRCDAMVQPLMPSIYQSGEYSFIFFNGEFSHAVQKKVQSGDYRIQRTYGGTTQGYQASDCEIRQASAALMAYTSRFSTPLLYARVDMVRDSNDAEKLLVMEIEATEPNLFFLYDTFNPGAASRFVRAALNLLVK